MRRLEKNIDTSFGETFWQFIKDGGYEHREKGTGENQFYRFYEPEDSSFPKMIELFSKLPNKFEISLDRGLTPIHIDESIVSLFAILLNDDYYELLLRGKRTVDGYSLIEIETVILFKMKAWLDMKKRKEAGEDIDTKNIKKHKNDVFRLLANVSPTSRIEPSAGIQSSVTQFIEQIREDQPDLKNLGLRGTSFDEMLEILGNIFLGKAEA